MMSKSSRSSWKHRAATTGSVQFKWKDLTGDRYPATDMLLPPFPRRRDTSPIFGDTGLPAKDEDAYGHPSHTLKNASYIFRPERLQALASNSDLVWFGVIFLMS
ncbi:unnamed protein product [Victoria cruziana]